MAITFQISYRQQIGAELLKVIRLFTLQGYLLPSRELLLSLVNVVKSHFANNIHSCVRRIKKKFFLLAHDWVLA